MPYSRRYYCEAGGLYKPEWYYSINTDSTQFPGLVGWWPGDPSGSGKLYDLGGMENHGTLSGFTYTGTSGWTAGNGGGRALSFDGTDDYVDLAARSVLNPTTTPVFWSMWVKARAFATYSTVVSKRHVASASGHQLFVTSSGKLAIYILASAGVSYDGTGTYTLSTNLWYHLAFSYDSVNGLKGYINGRLDKSVAPNGSLVSCPASTSLGTDLVTAGRYWNGLIEDARIYNRTLTAVEVADLYRRPWDLRYQVGRRVVFPPLGLTTSPSLLIHL